MTEDHRSSLKRGSAPGEVLGAECTDRYRSGAWALALGRNRVR